MTAWWKKTTLPNRQPAAPYSALAQIYDQVMDHVDYHHWAQYILKLARLHGKHPQVVLDVSCGTGSLSQKLSLHHIRVLACDSSLAMVQRANQKMKQEAQSISCWCSDMRLLSLRIPVDLVLSLYDSMNYLIDDADWLKALTQMHRQLNPAGLLIFDISTLHNSIETFAGYHHEQRTASGYYRRECYFDPQTALQYNYFAILLHQNPESSYSEVHRQRIRPLKEVEQLISRTPFNIAGTYADFTLRPGTEKADRVHFVLQKKDD